MTPRRVWKQRRHDERVTARWARLDQDTVIAIDKMSGFLNLFTLINDQTIDGDTARNWSDLAWWPRWEQLWTRVGNEQHRKTYGFYPHPYWGRLTFPAIRELVVGGIAADIIAVQPMTFPVGEIFFMDYRFDGDGLHRYQHHAGNGNFDAAITHARDTNGTVHAFTMNGASQESRCRRRSWDGYGPMTSEAAVVTCQNCLATMPTYTSRFREPIQNGFIWAPYVPLINTAAAVALSYDSVNVTTTLVFDPLTPGIPTLGDGVAGAELESDASVGEPELLVKG